MRLSGQEKKSVSNEGAAIAVLSLEIRPARPVW